MTPLEMEEEYIKCSESCEYFILNYISIVHPLRGTVPFNLYRFQKRIVKEIGTHRFNIIRKFRQAGVTTIMCAYALWYIIFQEDKNVMVVSIGERESSAFLERVFDMYDKLPKWLQPGIVKKNVHNFRLTTGSRIKSQPAGAGRSEAVSLLVVDEAAFIDNMREFWKAIFPTISTGGEAVLLSTVNGMSNVYYELYRDSVAGLTNFNVIDINWREHPEYTDEWAKTMRPTLGERAWLQEVLCQFLGTGDTFIDRDTLTRILEGISEDYRSSWHNRFRVWEEPRPGFEYLITPDPSYGVGRDNSAFHVICLNTGEQVAEYYSSSTKMRDFSQIVYETALAYNFALIACERNSLGIILIEDLLEELEYENMWFDEKGECGVLLSRAGRDAVLEALQDSLYLNRIKINSKRTAEEMVCFITTVTGKVQADSGYHDDLVVSLALASLVMSKLELAGEMPLLDGDRPIEANKGDTIFGSRPVSAKDEDFEEYRKWVLG